MYTSSAMTMHISIYYRMLFSNNYCGAGGESSLKWWQVGGTDKEQEAATNPNKAIAWECSSELSCT